MADTDTTTVKDTTGNSITTGKDDFGEFIEVNWTPPPPNNPADVPPPPFRFHPKAQPKVGPADPKPGKMIKDWPGLNDVLITIEVLDSCQIIITFILPGARVSTSITVAGASKEEKAALLERLKQMGKMAAVEGTMPAPARASFHARLSTAGEVSADISILGEPILPPGNASNRPTPIQTESPSVKFKTTIRAILGVSFLTGSEGGLRVGVVLPGSPAEVAGLRPGDALTQIGDASVSNFGDARGTLADLSAPVTLPITIRREDATLTVELTPGFFMFPYQTFSSGVKFNKFCDANCDCTIDQSGFLCVTVYVYVGQGPNGGVLLQKLCGAQESGLPRLDSACEVGEYI